MNQEIRKFLQRLNPWWSQPDFRFGVVEREYYLAKLMADDRWMRVLTGARRTGKTYLLYSIINKLLDSRLGARRILYLTGEAREVEEYGLEKVIEEYLETNKLKFGDKVYIFVDEIQEIEGWQKVVKYYYDQAGVKFYITGSSSLVLNKETSRLTGRFLKVRVLTLSFAEWLKFKGEKIETKVERNIERCEQYLVEGGYPESALRRSEAYIREAVLSTLYRDLLSHYGIRNPAFLEELIKYLADKVTNQVSPGRIKTDLKVDLKTARFYVEYLVAVYAVYPCWREGRSYRITKASVPKYYFNDTGALFLLAINKKIGQLAENAVFLKLLSESVESESSQVSYTEVEGREIDFMRGEELIEVKYREITAEELKWYQNLPRRVTLVVKKMPDKRVAEKNQNIRFVEMWKFLGE